MNSLLANTVQPSLMTLLSSTSQPSLSPLWSRHVGASQSTSFISVEDDDRPPITSELSSSGPRLIPKHISGGSLAQPVIHLQSPRIHDTYMQIGTSKTEYDRSKEKGKGRAPEVQKGLPPPLGAELPWLGVHLRRLGRRHFSLEVGFVDRKGREGIIRCSTFKTEPEVHPRRKPPLLHLPLNVPPRSTASLTPWLDISLNINALIPLFQTVQTVKQRSKESTASESDQEGYDGPDRHRPPRPSKRRKKDRVDLPAGSMSNITYIRIYANCRVRRMWLAEDGERTLEALGQARRYDFGLFASR